MDKKSLGVSIVAILIAIGGLFTGGGQTVVEKVANGGGQAALTSPIIPYPYFGFGDVIRYAGHKSLATATTTVCAIQSPTATSTLVSAGVSFSVASTTATRVTLAKAATAFATTTSLGAATIAANAQGTIIATTTPVDGLDEDKVFGPSQWFVVGMQGGIGTFSPTGTCQATWEAF